MNTRNLKNQALLLLGMTALMACTEQPEAKDYMQYVDTMIGTGAHYSEDAAGLWHGRIAEQPGREM